MLAARTQRPVREVALTLLMLPGLGPLTASKPVGETAAISRF